MQVLAGKLENVNERKSWFFEKINKVDKPLERQKKRRETQIANVRNAARLSPKTLQRPEGQRRKL